MTFVSISRNYHQLLVWLEDVPKTAFRTRYEIYEFLAMPFGLTITLAVFLVVTKLVFHATGPVHHRIIDDILISPEPRKNMQNKCISHCRHSETTNYMQSIVNGRFG